ncbi:hypothetical protein [Nonomuraea sp. SYSU D8015]|uniref:hypothetical protein n=1 Tax=Nonomuraea sp. SYSU D8015 TaxID=2593644 RepID=UPI00166047A0|nr:hypothetical protein [Nonomuraea sp. SYSU D8015]
MDVQRSAWVQGAYVFLGATGGGVEAGTWGAPGAQWAQLRTSFTTGPSTTSVTVHVNGWYGQGAYLADDVVLDGPGGTPDTHAPTVPGNVARRRRHLVLALGELVGRDGRRRRGPLRGLA